MTLSDLTSKTPGELNVMCAELCGWQAIVTHPTTSYLNDDRPVTLPGGLFGTSPELTLKAVPNYTGSWDAIMPEVRKLTEDQFINYLVHLTDVADATQIGQFRAHYDSRLVTIALILTLTSQH